MQSSGNGICEDGIGEDGVSCFEDCGNNFAMTTTFAGGNSQGGNFFNIEVKQDIAVTGLEINAGAGDVSVEVYYYAGSYSGVMSNPSAWTLLIATTVVSAGSGSGTPVEFYSPVPLSSGSHAFYVTRTDGAYLIYTNGAAENSVQVEDPYVKILQGRGVVYPFGGTFVPRIWNGILKYRGSACTVPSQCDDGDMCNGEETCDTGTGICQQGTPFACTESTACGVAKNFCNPSSQACEAEAAGSSENGQCDAGETWDMCPNDCSGTPHYGASAELTTTFASGVSQAGNMFNVKTKDSIAIKGFNIHTAAGTWDVLVYTYPGPFLDVMSDANAWTLVQNVTGVSGGNNVALPDLDTEIQLAAESTQAIYITTVDGTMYYTGGTSEGAVHSEDDKLIFYEGRGISYPFASGGSFVPRVWNGVIRYQTLEAGSEPQPTPGPSAAPSDVRLMPSYCALTFELVCKVEC